MRGYRPAAAAMLAAIGAGLPSVVRAGPPYVTDDPEPTDPGTWEIYGFGAETLFVRANGGSGGLDLNYGGARDLQLSAVVSLAYDHAAGQPTRIGLADAQLGAKYRFLHQAPGSAMPDVGLFPKINLPIGGRRFGAGRVGVSLPLWAQKDFGRWSLFGGGGWTLHPGPGNRDYAFAGVALVRQVTRCLAIGGEVYHQTADAVDTRPSTGLGLGATWLVAPHWSLIGSGGPLLQHRAIAGDYAFYAALEFHG